MYVCISAYLYLCQSHTPGCMSTRLACTMPLHDSDPFGEFVCALCENHLMTSPHIPPSLAHVYIRGDGHGLAILGQVHVCLCLHTHVVIATGTLLNHPRLHIQCVNQYTCMRACVCVHTSMDRARLYLPSAVAVSAFCTNPFTLAIPLDYTTPHQSTNQNRGSTVFRKNPASAATLAAGSSWSAVLMASSASYSRPIRRKHLPSRTKNCNRHTRIHEKARTVSQGR